MEKYQIDRIMNDKTTFFKNKLFVSAFLVVFIISSISTAVFAVDYNSSRGNVKLTSKMKEVRITDPATIDKILDAADEEIKAYANYKNIRKNIAVKTIAKTEVGKELANIAVKEEGIKRIGVAFDNLIQAAENYNAARSNLVGLLKAAGVKDDTKIDEFLDVLYEPINAADTIYDAINQTMVDFPLLEKIFGNERMNVYIGEQAPFNIVTSGGKVESLGAGEIGNPSMKVYADTGTVNQLIAGEMTPLDALQQGKIRYKGVGLVKSVKFKVLGVVVGLMSRFGMFPKISSVYL